MGRRLGLLSFGLVVVICLLSPTQAHAAGGGCTAADQRAGTCYSGVAEGDEAVLRGSQATTGASTDRGPGQRPAQSKGSVALTAAQIQALLDAECYGDGTCGNRDLDELNPLFLPDDAQPADPAPGAPAQVVTIADLARFLPATARLHAEPAGWAVIGVPANFWVHVVPVTVDGELLGGPAQVRFTPQLYRWDYGDGASRTTATGGSSWADLGQDELTATSTSHDYTARGTVDPAVTVVYSAAYHVGGGDWQPVAGAVTGTTPPAPVLVVHEATALTAGAEQG